MANTKYLILRVLQSLIISLKFPTVVKYLSDFAAKVKSVSSTRLRNDHHHIASLFLHKKNCDQPKRKFLKRNSRRNKKKERNKKKNGSK